MPLPHLHLLPGLHGTPELYQPLLDRLGDHPHSATCYASDPAQTADDVLAAIAESVPQGTPYVLLAESFSGSFATKFAATRPDNLVGLVLVNTFLRLPLAPLTCGVAQSPAPMPWFVSRWLLFSRDSAPELRALTRRIVSGLSPKLIAARFRLLYRSDARPAAAQVRVPTLVLHGADDWFVLPYNSRRIERAIPGAVRKKLPGPHLLVQTHPEQSLGVIRDWWASQTG